MFQLLDDIRANFAHSRWGAESESESCQKRGLRMSPPCFHNLAEYNEITDSALGRLKGKCIRCHAINSSPKTFDNTAPPSPDFQSL